MITKSMTSEEVLKELKKDDLYVMDRWDGLLIKNKKKLKSKFVKNKDIMSVSTYVVPETRNTVVVYATKYISTLKGRDYSSMILNCYYKTCYETYIVPSFKNSDPVGYVEYTHHSVDRMKTRLGKDFDTFFREDWIKRNEGSMVYVDYDYNGDANERVAHVGDAFLIVACDSDGKRSVVKTILSTADLHSHQLQNKLNSMKKVDRLNEIVVERIDAEAEEHLKKYKRMGLVRKVA